MQKISENFDPNWGRLRDLAIFSKKKNLTKIDFSGITFSDPARNAKKNLEILSPIGVNLAIFSKKKNFKKKSSTN